MNSFTKENAILNNLQWNSYSKFNNKIKTV